MEFTMQHPVPLVVSVDTHTHNHKYSSLHLQNKTSSYAKCDNDTVYHCSSYNQISLNLNENEYVYYFRLRLASLTNGRQSLEDLEWRLDKNRYLKIVILYFYVWMLYKLLKKTKVVWIFFFFLLSFEVIGGKYIQFKEGILPTTNEDWACPGIQPMRIS